MLRPPGGGGWGQRPSLLAPLHQWPSSTRCGASASLAWRSPAPICAFPMGRGYEWRLLPAACLAPAQARTSGVQPVGTRRVRSLVSPGLPGKLFSRHFGTKASSRLSSSLSFWQGEDDFYYYYLISFLSPGCKRGFCTLLGTPFRTLAAQQGYLHCTNVLMSESLEMPSIMCEVFLPGESF